MRQFLLVKISNVYGRRTNLGTRGILINTSGKWPFLLLFHSVRKPLDLFSLSADLLNFENGHPCWIYKAVLTTPPNNQRRNMLRVYLFGLRPAELLADSVVPS